MSETAQQPEWMDRNLFDDLQSGLTTPLRKTQRQMTPQEKASEVTCGFEIAAKRAECEYLFDLEYQLTKSLVWSGKCLTDMLFFICNWHPFLGMLLSHPRHPWSKWQRFMTFFVSCAMTLLPTAWLIRSLDERGVHDKVLTSGSVFIVITFPVMLVEKMLYCLTVGGALCRGTWCHPLTYVVAFVRRSCFCVSFLAAVTLAVMSFVKLNGDNPQELVRPLVISRLQSYVTWFPIALLMPCSGFVASWRKEKKKALARRSSDMS
mmetsp:Transcript_111828/g.312631  ORF Transcript_111828/g.312631 Transcript_111828/m.312631 type:complete len:263 (-) Transcript_111828:186-974(-)